jgi:hypothetical protein
LVKCGDLVMLRAVRDSNRPDVHASPQRIDRLASILSRYGEDFGSVEILGRVENAKGR